VNGLAGALRGSRCVVGHTCAPAPGVLEFLQEVKMITESYEQAIKYLKRMRVELDGYIAHGYIEDARDMDNWYHGAKDMLWKLADGKDMQEIDQDIRTCKLK
jgi:hypothetical protein